MSVTGWSADAAFFSSERSTSRSLIQHRFHLPDPSEVSEGSVPEIRIVPICSSYAGQRTSSTAFELTLR